MIRLTWRERVAALVFGQLPARRARYDGLPEARTKPIDQDGAMIAIFERAFSGRVAGLRRRCACGVEYWDAYNDGYDWEEGEREGLEKDPKAVPVDYAIGTVVFEGRYYADACTCWHERAKRISDFLIGHDQAVADFLTAVKKDLEQRAAKAPEVKS